MGNPSIEFNEETQEVSVPPFQPVVPPVAEGDGSIFVSIVSYRGKRKRDFP